MLTRPLRRLHDGGSLASLGAGILGNADAFVATLIRGRGKTGENDEFDHHSPFRIAERISRWAAMRAMKLSKRERRRNRVAIYALLCCARGGAPRPGSNTPAWNAGPNRGRDMKGSGPPFRHQPKLQRGKSMTLTSQPALAVRSLLVREACSRMLEAGRAGRATHFASYRVPELCGHATRYHTIFRLCFRQRSGKGDLRKPDCSADALRRLSLAGYDAPWGETLGRVFGSALSD